MADRVQAAVPEAPQAAASVFRAYLATVSAWFSAWGVQTVLFPWLVVGVLEESPERVGIAQMATLLPSLLFLLHGGATADRHDTRKLMILFYGIAVAPSLVMAGIVAADALTYPALIVYALVLGTLNAYAFPARDSMLSRAAGRAMINAVAGMTVVQALSQMLGLGIGAAARWTGPAVALLIQAGLFLFGARAAMWLPPAPPVAREGPRVTGLAEIKEGLVEVAKSSEIRPMIITGGALGLFFIGAFQVAYPLMVRDVYDGTVTEIAMGNVAFSAGMISTSMAIMRFGIRRKGRAVLAGLFYGCFSLTAMGAGFPYPVMLAAIFLWGTGAGIVMSATRALVQEAAAESHRARILSVYQLAMTGSGPLGALGAGFLVANVGIPLSFLIPSLCMMAVVLSMAVFSDLWKRDGEAAPV